MKHTKKYTRGFILLIVLVVISGCSTKKNTLITRGYHNLTSQYNIYFNASEIKKEAHKKIETSWQEDFNSILPIDIYSKREVASRLLPDMDKIIRKCSKVITMHSITAKPKRRSGANVSEKKRDFYRKNEYNKWIDDSYFLMGQAYHLKNDQFPAIQNFEYVIRQFPDDGLKEEANLWLAKCHLALKDYRASKDLLDRLEADPQLDDELRGEIAVVRADWHLRQDMYAEGYAFLDEAVRMIKDKKRLRRYTYILAQLLEEQGDFAQASLRYAEVISLNPDYRMAFNARINRAKLYEGDAETGAEIRKQLQKMLRDDKNAEFLDQIYYALAEIDMKEGLEEEAIKKYRLSAQSSLDNTHQRSLSYLALGRIYYGRNDYLPAQEFYDSCMVFLPETFPDREEIQNLGLSLNTLGENLRVVHREDSLQAIALMPEEERDALIAVKIAEAEKAEEERIRRAEEERMAGRNTNFRMAGGGAGGGGGRLAMAPGSMNAGGAGGAQMGGVPGGMSNAIGSTGSSWYFYNPTTLSYGQGEFQKIWGRRKLSDNWRRTNQGIASAMTEMSTEGEEGDVITPGIQSKAGQFSPTQQEYYLADLPVTDSQLFASNERIQAGLFNVGKVFKDNLDKKEEAAKYFTQLIERFPETDRLLFSYYNLYQLYEKQGNKQLSDYYKGLILSKFPDSRSAQIISNPNYFREIEEERMKAIGFYEGTYTAFLEGKYAEVIQRCEQADTSFGVNPIRDKFGLLKVMSVGALEPDNAALMINRLNELVFKFPNSDIKETADILIDYYKGGSKSVLDDGRPTIDGMTIGKPGEPATATSDEFVFAEDKIHFYVAVVSRQTRDLNRMTFNISNFNTDNFDQSFYEVSTAPLNDDLMVIVVKNFTSVKAGMDYFYALQADPLVFAEFQERDFRQFIISNDNYNLLTKNKNVFKYIQFFNSNYLNAGN